MPVDPALLARYKRQLSNFTDRTGALLVAAWDALPGYDEADIDEFVDRATPALVSGRSAAVALSAAFYAFLLRTDPVAVDAEAIDVSPDLRGPFRATWHALTMGHPYESAVRTGRSTAQAVGFDFVQSTARRTGGVIAEGTGREVRWRRSPGARSCSWCQEMATHTWPTAEAADFGHERDGCVVVPA